METLSVKEQIDQIEPGAMFLVQDLLTPSHYKPQSLHKELFRLAQKGIIQRLSNGIYFKPKSNHAVKGVLVAPKIDDFIAILSRRTSEKIQVHGDSAAKILGLSAQDSIYSVYTTTGLSRDFMINGVTVRLIHSANKLYYQYPLNHPVGLAISALLNFGTKVVDREMIVVLKRNLSVEHFDQLKNSDLPKWLMKIVESVD